MSRSHQFVTWLCCLLVLWTGVPLRSHSPCDDVAAGTALEVVQAGEARSCCSFDCHCCERDGGVQACECRSGDPTPNPAATPPHTEPIALPEAGDVPKRQEVVPPPRLQPCLATTLPIGLLPRVSRQKALSVWNC